MKITFEKKKKDQNSKMQEISGTAEKNSFVISFFNCVMCDHNEFDPILLEIELKRRQDSNKKENDESIEVPDINANRNGYKILSWEIKAGDAIAFDFRTLHGASENVNKLSRRRIFSARIVGDDAFFVDRGGKGSPPFENIKLKTGDKLVGEEFPIIYQ